MPTNKPILAILGAGKLGIVIAQLAVKAGYEVYISGSGSPSKIALSIKIIVPGAIAVTSSEAINKADVVILALPLSKYKTLDPGILSGKLVIDSMNYWWEVDGDMPDLTNAPSSSEMIQSFLVGSRVVKALSHMGYHDLHDKPQPLGTPNRKAIAVASDNKKDAEIVSDIIDDLGFDPVYIGRLSAGKFLEPGMLLFGASVSADKISSIIQSDSRY